MSSDDSRLVRHRTACSFCAEPPFAVYDLRAPSPRGQWTMLAALCWDHHAEIAMAEDGWTDPTTGRRWRLYKLSERLRRSPDRGTGTPSSNG